ncbi:MAG: hypothetical protein COB78_05185 [Hyphomicrobiales bacterium]|nr:MAG: hypothetical protein COB78_05185 [Hyphomicrobiales bacterium]
MIKRLLHAGFASLMLLAISACVASKEPLSLGEGIQLLPAHALLQYGENDKAEFYRLVYSKGIYQVFEKGSANKPDPMALYKLPGLPKGYHIGWMPLGIGTSYEDNYYNIAWLEKSPAGQRQIVIFSPSDKNKIAIARAMNVNPKDGPQIKNTKEMIAYSQTLFKMSNELQTSRFNIYDLSNKEDYTKAEALAGTAFLTPSK